ncbi:Agamous-like MADS-box protein [Nymphaea thermarum]|nr:Agamous-like MADS-box protein [Nymphaea thermarum]
MKKAGELCILCRVEIAIIVFSPAGKAFSYDEPSVDVVINRFLDPSSHVPAPSDVHRASTIEELNRQHNELVQQIEAEKKLRVLLQKLHRGMRRHGQPLLGRLHGELLARGVDGRPGGDEVGSGQARQRAHDGNGGDAPTIRHQSPPPISSAIAPSSSLCFDQLLLFSSPIRLLLSWPQRQLHDHSKMLVEDD